jgi:hypothetical protein
MVALSPSVGRGGGNRRFVSPCAALGESGEGDWSVDFGVSGADPGVEVLAAQSVAIAFEREDL